MSARFAILHHQGFGGEHWDLMLEHGDVLLTWQLEEEPTPNHTLPIRAQRIGDHRKAYLSYEGPISRGRGQVRRVDDGDVIFEEITAACLRFRLSGQRLIGTFALVERDDENGEGWEFREHASAEE